jgi:uncharacterized phage protein gp47/JayE
MTFVAEPYEQFADDIMTALTGGVVREQHRYTGPEAVYSLTTPDAIPASLKVVGVRAEQFRVFEMGIDYDYRGVEEAIAWRSAGAVPDDGSYFYINYYPRDAQRRLTDRNPGSVVSVLSSAFGRTAAVLSKQIELVYRSGFLDLAEGASVDHIAALLGLERKDARFSSGEVLFKRSTPAPADIAIPAGTLVSTRLGVTFETSEKRTLRRGQLAVTAPVRAQPQGKAGQVGKDEIVIVNRPIFGVDVVTNEAPTVFAAGKESDDEFRRRIRSTLDRAGKSTLDAIKYTLVEELPEVTEANIQVTESGEMRGLVEVKLGVDASAAPDLAQRVEAAILASRPAGVRVTHNIPSSSAATAADRQGITRAQAVADFRASGDPPGTIELPADVLAKMPDGALELRVEVLIRLTQRNLTAGEKDQIEDEVRATVMRYVEALPMGVPLIHTKLLGQIVAPDPIADAALLVGARLDGPWTGYAGNLSTRDRKARVDIYSVFVGLMDEQVWIDLRVRLDGERAPAGAESAVREAAARHLAQAKEKLVLADLRAAIAAAAKGLGAQLAAGDAVVMGAEFEETGRLLAAATEVLIGEHEVLVLRNLVLDVKGMLDA